MKKRDWSLDFIKGIACILMFMAHSLRSPLGGGSFQMFINHLLGFIGGLAPVLFFAVSGITAMFQAKKNMRGMVILYTLFAIVGLSYNLIWRPNLYVDFASDIFQIIAMGTIITVFLEKYLKPNKWLYFLLAILIFVIHYSTTRNIDPFIGKQLLFAPGTFTLFPWLSMFFLGVFFYKLKPIISLIFSVVFSLILLLLIYFYKLDQISQKFDMSIGYFLVSMILVSFSFYISRNIKETRATKIVTYFGENSLLFLYVNMLLVMVLRNLISNHLIYYVLTISLVYPVMEISKMLNKYVEKYFYNYLVWVILILVICITPILTSNVIIIKLTGVFIGLFFANNYKKLSVIVFNLNKAQRATPVKGYGR